MPACVPAAAARVLGLAPGDLVTLRDPSTHATVRVRVTGTFRRAEPDEPYWMLDPMGASAVQRTHGFTTAGPLVTSPVAIAGAHLAITSATEIGLPDFRRLTGTGVAALGSHLAIRVSDLNSSTSFHDATVTTSLPGQLSALATALVVARTKILAGILTLLVIAGATLGIAARLLAQRREAETALLGARGASRTQIARRCLADALVVAIPAAVAGPLLGEPAGPAAGWPPDGGPDRAGLARRRRRRGGLRRRHRAAVAAPPAVADQAAGQPRPAAFDRGRRLRQG